MGLGGCVLKKAKSAAADAAATKVTAEQLARDYQADERAADKKYKGKVLLLSGEVVAAWSVDGDVRVMLKGIAPAKLVVLEFKRAFQDRARSLNSGQPVTVKGRSAGLVSDFPWVRDCELVKSGPEKKGAE
jgi:hypothetical protein